MPSTIEISSSLHFELETHPSEDVKLLLANTVYGKKGKMQYRHNDAYKKVGSLTNPLFLNLRKSGRLLATVTVLKNHVAGSSDYFTYYFRYFSFPINLRANSSSRSRYSNSKTGKIKSELKELFNSGFSSADDYEKSVYYAFVEKDNLDSWNICDIYGFEKVRSLRTLVFSRFKPRLNSNVRKAVKEDKEYIREALAETYRNYSFFVKDKERTEEDYYIYEENGLPIAGLKAVTADWDIIHVPGMEGFLIQHILPRLPLLSQIFPFPKMRFLALDAVWVKNDNEEAILKLIESVCALKGRTIAIYWSDAQCSIGSLLEKSGRLGLIHRIKKNVPADICFRFNRFEKREIEVFRNKPVYITASDLI